MMLALLAPVLLVWSPKVGDRVVYKVVETGRTMDMTLKLDGTATETTTKVEGGRVTQSRESTMYGEAPGHPRSRLPNRSLTITYRLDGGVADVETELYEEDAFRIERLRELALPKAPVDVGGTWSVELPPDPKASNTGLKTTYTLAGEEKVGAWNAWKIDAKGGETGDSKAQVEATFWIDKATGARVRVHSKVTGAAFPGDGGRTVGMDEDLVRQP